MRFAITVTGPAYGTQQASSALQFARAVLQEGHELLSIFFYREGVYNANQLTAPGPATKLIWFGPGRRCMTNTLFPCISV